MVLKTRSTLNRIIIGVILSLNVACNGYIVPLPSSLLEKTPVCAWQCVADFVKDNLIDCPISWSLECLCQSSGANGYTLGEGALACMATVCPLEVLQEQASVFQICNDQDDAAAMTHDTLEASQVTSAVDHNQDLLISTLQFPTLLPTLFSPETEGLPSSTLTNIATSAQSMAPYTSTMQTTTMPTSTSLSASATISQRYSSLSTSHTTERISVRNLSSASLTTSLSSTAISNTALSSSLSSPSKAAATTEASLAHPSLKAGQVAGVFVGVAAAATLIGGVLFCCRKRRRHSRENSEAEDMSEVPTSPTSPEEERLWGTGGGPSGADRYPSATVSPMVPPPVALPPRLQNNQYKPKYRVGLPTGPAQHRLSWLLRSGKVGPKLPERPRASSKAAKADAATHLTLPLEDYSSESSPMSAASYHTTSQLLPDKPAYQSNATKSTNRHFATQSLNVQPQPPAVESSIRRVPISPDATQRGGLQGGHAQASPDLGQLRGQNEEHYSTENLKLADPFVAHLGEDNSKPSKLLQAFKASQTGHVLHSPSKSGYQQERDNRALIPTQVRQHGWLPRSQNNVNSSTVPQADSPPPLLPETAPFSPFSSGFAIEAGSPYDRSSPNPMLHRHDEEKSSYFNSQPFQTHSTQKVLRHKKKPRPETHYTTSSETDFEDDDPSSADPDNYETSGIREFSIATNFHAIHDDVVELPDSSPLHESPVRRLPAQERIRGPANASDRFSPSLRNQGDSSSTGTSTSPVNLVRYPGIPGTGTSPKREVKTTRLRVDTSYRAPVHIGQLQSAENSSATDSVTPLDIKYSAINQRAVGYKDRGSGPQDTGILRSSRVTHNDLRATAMLQRAEPAKLTQPRKSVSRQSTASRLAASTPGRRGPLTRVSGLGSWPVQPVHSSIRPKLKIRPPTPDQQVKVRQQGHALSNGHHSQLAVPRPSCP